MHRLIIIALLLSAASPPHKQGKPVHKELSPAEYAASVAGVDSCNDFTAKAATLLDATPLIVDAISDDHGTTKDEFETTAQFESRQTDYWRSHLGDPEHLVIRVPIDSYRVSYDADRGLAVVKYIANSYSDHTALQFFHESQTTGHYVGQNAYGATANVTSFHDTEAVLSFPPGQLGEASPYISPEFQLSLSPEQARAFKEHPSLLILARLEPPYVDTTHSYSAATIDEPESLAMETKNLHVRLRCAVFMVGSEVVSPNVVKSM